MSPWHELISAWGAAMFRAGAQGGAALTLVCLLCRVFPNLPPRLKCWLWRLAYLKLLIALVWSSPVILPVLPRSHVRPAIAKSPPPQMKETSSSKDRRPVTGQNASPADARPPYLLCGLFLLWLLTVLAFGVGWIRNYRVERQVLRTSHPLHDQSLLAIYARLCNALRISCPTLLQNKDEQSPRVIGRLAPTILVPSWLRDRREFELLAAHELAHVKSRDLWWGILPALANALFFPLGWLTGGWRLTHECAADEMAINLTKAPHPEYGELLVKVAALSTRPPGMPALAGLGLYESFQSLEARLLAMKAFGSTSRRFFLMTAMIAMIGICGIVPWRVTAQGKVIRDDFDGLSMSAAWRTRPGIGSASLTENPGSLRYRLTDPTHPGDTNALWLFRSFSGARWQFDTKVRYSIPKGTGRQFVTYIIFGNLEQRRANSAAFWRDRDDGGGAPRNRIWGVFVDGGVEGELPGSGYGGDGRTVFCAPVYDSEVYFVRIARNQQHVSIQVSPDGSRYRTLVTQTFRSALGSLQTLLLSGASFSNEGGFADYDFVQVAGDVKDVTSVPVAINVLPEESANVIDQRDPGQRLPVAILSNSRFDARRAVFGDLGDSRGNERIRSFRKVERDVNGDGYPDAEFFFPLGLMLDGRALDGQSRELLLTGQLSDGTDFFGSDSIRVAGR